MIRIRKSQCADTRSARHLVTKEELMKDTKAHIRDVKRGMDFFAELLQDAGDDHDWTKLKFFDEFYKQFHKAQKTGEWGKGWYDELHLPYERHHLNERVPEDVDLLDVLEMICDNVMAGMARSGEYRYAELPAGLLETAYKNTVKMLLGQVVVEPKGNSKLDAVLEDGEAEE